MPNEKHTEADDLQAPKPPEQHNFLAMSGSYAIGEEQLTPEDYIKHLEDLRSKLLTRRRQLAFDAYKHSIVYMGRAIDISKLQPLISAVEGALAHERSKR
ncbi:hypothetical protein EN833_13520 [Mesorhizobium sp. M4B.F.Ca.ET.190.01.1.1]|uniref:hypothetical protein n=1 Tax=unclassified Mesorhizobium TaxID=325217 RepID=UPI001092DB29|nr:MULTISPECIES: hypothetical protein [unclassified Mesorhizobium]TGR10542.1 hypothetical protein EN843_13515 [Mesorhizobium sp. M4B.F.Ca.ET.200.01.1.1]TGS19632.1 hypothetical protein EN833_13520 [Mesorhizobium sp. M4B.F.Ca.ET.190.01.1.1]TGT32402.1 hypothetical protein EN815_07915 [Mesorhizobium sp. M4B.F.Ca.ET.172.01.1.1]